MQNRRILGFGFLLLLPGVSALWAAPPATDIIGIVTERQGSAYRQSDSKKTPVAQQAELLTDAKLVLSKGSKLVVVYLTSGLEYELNGPAVVQFKNDKPISLSGLAPKILNAKLPFSGKASIIDPKKVHTAGQTLVSTEKKEIQSMPVAAAPAPLPAKVISGPIPPLTASVEVAAPAPVQMADYELEQQKMAAYAAARKSAEAESASAKSEVAKSEAWKAEKEAAETAYSAAQQDETMSEDTKPADECLDSDSEANADNKTADSKTAETGKRSRNCR
ncbi:MAG: hypothetical protein ABI644_00945 [Arenimonas sp.]